MTQKLYNVNLIFKSKLADYISQCNRLSLPGTKPTRDGSPRHGSAMPYQRCQSCWVPAPPLLAVEVASLPTVQVVPACRRVETVEAQEQA